MKVDEASYGMFSNLNFMEHVKTIWCKLRWIDFIENPFPVGIVIVYCLTLSNSFTSGAR